MFKPHGCESHSKTLGDVVHSSKGDNCTQFKGKVMEDYNARQVLKSHLEDRGFTLDNGSCKDDGFTVEKRFHRFYKKEVEITEWHKATKEF